MIDPSKRMTNLLRLGERFVEVGAAARCLQVFCKTCAAPLELTPLCQYVSISLEFWWFDSFNFQMCVRSTLSVLLCLACVLYQFYSDLSHAWFSLGLVWKRVTFDAFQAYCSCCPKKMFYLKMVVGRRTYKIRARLRASTFLRCLNCRKGASTKHSSTAVHIVLIVLIVLFVLYESLLSSII